MPADVAQLRRDDNFATPFAHGVHSEKQRGGRAWHHADYIIMGSHRHLAAHHLFNGNIFSGILKRSRCPTMVVPVKADA